jgi:two-component system KDP operon response regulator KdpE
VGKRILVIDDESSIRQVLGIHLQRAGYEVVIAETAAEGVELAGGDIDLVICDFQLPDMTGLEVIRSIRGKSEGMPIVIISGFLDDWLAEDVLASGAAELLRKPFQKESLLEAVERIFFSEEKCRQNG